MLSVRRWGGDYHPITSEQYFSKDTRDGKENLFIFSHYLLSLSIYIYFFSTDKFRKYLFKGSKYNSKRETHPELLISLG